MYKEILFNELGNRIFDTLKRDEMDYDGMVNRKALQALQRVKAAVENDSLNDFECIEEIVRILEDIGSDGGNRHDFT